MNAVHLPARIDPVSAVHVAARFDPFRAQVDCLFEARHGATIQEIVDGCRPPEWFPVVGHVAIRNAAGVTEVPREHWGKVRPKPGTFVAVYALPMGGGGGGGGSGKSVLRAVAALAVLAVATVISAGFLAPVLGASFAAGGIGATLLGAGVGIAGALAINALTPPPLAPNLNTPGATAQSEAGSDFGAQRIAGVNGNTLARGAQIPCVVGSMVASPPLLARPYTSFANNDTYIHAVVGLWGRHQITDLKINGTDAALIPDLQIETREGTAADARITVAPDTIIEDRTVGQLSEFKLDRTNVTQVATPGNPAASYPIWHYATTDGAADKIRIRVQFPSGMVQNDLTTGQQVAIAVPLRIAIRKIGDAAWINLPELHYRDPDATTKPMTQEIVIDWEERAPNNATTLDANRMTYRAYGYTGPEAHKWTPNSWFLYSAADYTPSNTAINDDGVIFYLGRSTIPRGQYEIRMMRGLAYVGASTGAASHPGNLFEASGTEVQVAQRDKVSAMYCETVQTFRRAYPITASQPLCLIAVRGRGLQLESISATFTSYASVWDGSSWTIGATPTANPAAIYRRMLVDYHEVTGKLPAVMRDDATLGAWYSHCEAMGYQINAIFDGGTLQENLQIVAAAGWAVPLYGQKWGVVMERDRSSETPVQLMTPLTGRGLQYSKAFESVPHAIAAEFNDAIRDYRIRDDVFVYRPGYDATNATDYETINYKGITAEVAARARAKLDIGQMLYRRTTYKLDIWIEHLMARRGDLVLLSHDSLGTRYAFARIASVDTQNNNVVAIRLDQEVTLPAGFKDLFSIGDLLSSGDLFATGAAAAVAIRASTGATVTRPVAALDGTNVITFDDQFPDDGTVVPGCIVAVGARGVTTRRCIVFDVRRNDLETATVTLVDEAPRLHQ
jgi:hypothetical protein